tara:strand:- start:3752 stop:5542 length:1791 start_codon:yes stop_codon:yes gene_type:complete
MATNTATSFTNHTAPSSGSTAGPYAISFNYLEQSDVDVTVDGVLQTLSVAYTFTSGTQITFTSGNEPANGAAIVIKRDTNISAKKVDFQDGSVLTETDLDTNTEQLLFGLQEFTDKINGIEDLSTRDMDALEIKIAYESNSNTNAFTDAEQTKLSGIEASATADQTAAEIRTLVESATDSNVFTDADHAKLDSLSNVTNAILNSDLDGKGELLVGDGSGNPTALPVGTDGYVLKADSNEPTGVKWSLATANAPLNQSLNASNLTSGTIPNSVFPATLPAISGTNLTNLNASNLSSGTVPDARFPATLPAASATNLTSIPAGQLTGALPAIDGSALTNLPSGGTTYSAGSGLILTGTTFSVDTLNQNTTGSAATLTTARNIAGVAFDGSADISLNNNAITNGAGYIDGSALNATNLTSGTIPDARFPATLPAVSAANLTSIPAANITGTLPAISGANLTNLPAADLSSLNASNLSSGTIPDARFPATLPAISGANLTNLPAGNLSNLDASNLTSGTIPDARFPATLPAISGANLTNLPSGAGSLVGGSGEEIFVEVDNEMNNSFTTTSGRNYIALSNLSIATGVVFTITTGTIVNFT